MCIKRFLWLTWTFVSCFLLQAQTVNYPSKKITHTSFAIFTDQQTWQHCQAEFEAYKDVLEQEQLPTFIIHDNWEKPEDVKDIIMRLYRENKLEGCVFVGDIPIPMIRKAQHLTSAFKMDEDTDWHKSSVPSDRFYDDLHLEFDFIRQDSLRPSFFYYELATKSPQHIRCDIYSARIKPLVAKDMDPYQQIRDYLRKVVEEHRSPERLNQFFSYTGHGSYSNSLTAWTMEAFTLREQMPGVFDHDGRARFMRYDFTDYPKNEVINAIRRTDLDLAIFHEHGTFDRQYLSSTPPTTTLAAHITRMKADRRNYARSWIKDEKALHKAYADLDSIYGLDSTWFAGRNDPAMLERDSLDDLRTGLILTDITAARPNVRMVIFDACYNGDFREDDYIAGRYIFTPGRCLVTFANSVNVLQDKQANELLGLLGMGARVGQWAKLTNVLESHIIGDPTYRFASFNGIDASALCVQPYDEAAQLDSLASSYADIQCLALHNLQRNGYQDISSLLRHTFESSTFATVRYTALALLEKLNDDNFRAILPKALTDPNEFIRRTAVHKMAAVGCDSYVLDLVKTYVENLHDARVAFNILLSLYVFNPESVNQAIEQVLDSTTYIIHDKEKIRAALRSAYSKRTSSDSTIIGRQETDRWRSIYIKSLRNQHIHGSVDSYLQLLESPNETEEIKITMLQALAWFRSSYRRPDIATACDRLRRSANVSETVRAEAERTYYRLTND